MDLKMLADLPPWEWPNNAGELFLARLRDREGDEDERLLVIELAGDFTVINDELALALLSLSESGGEPPELRGQAAISLGAALEHSDTMGFEDADDIVISEDTFVRIQESLQRVHGDDGAPEEVRRRALEASVRAPQDWHREAIERAYSRPEVEWKRTAVFCMRFVQGFGEDIVGALGSTDAETHEQAILAAANWEIQEAWPHVATLLDSEDIDKGLLLAVIEAVPFLRPREAWDLLASFEASEDEDIAEAAIEAQAMAEALTHEDGDDEETVH